MMENDRRKRQSESQRLEYEGVRLIERLLAREWVHHGYTHDYGVDRVIEVFERDASAERSAVAQTLGEMLFVQVKAAAKTRIVKRVVRPRDNVALGSVSLPGKDAEKRKISVVRQSVDVALLNTVSAIGSAIPFMLFVPSLDDERLYFVCLNDYIDKVLIPEHPIYREQESVSVFIPATNVVSRTDYEWGMHALRLYAKRAKYYAAFSLFNFQYRQMQNIGLRPPIIEHFLKIVRSFDFWNHPDSLPVMHETHRQLEQIAVLIGEPGWEDDQVSALRVLGMWGVLSNLGDMFEEVHREAYLPTFLGDLLYQP